MNIADFRANLADYGVARTNRFLFSCRVPTILLGKYNSRVGELLTYRAQSASVPGVALMTSDVVRYGHDTIQKMPFSATFLDNSVTFIADRDGVIYNFFYDWINGIYNFGGDQQSNGTYRVEYKDKFISEAAITSLDQYDGEISTTVLESAFPVNMHAVPYDWADNNNLVRLTIDFTFKDWYIQNPQAQP